jgi:hypothetical protein
MKNILMIAYDMKVNQITWIDSEHYDIVATGRPVQAHRASRNQGPPAVRIGGGKNGSKLKPYIENPNAPQPEPGKPFAMGKDGVPIPRPGSVMMTMSAGQRRVRPQANSPFQDWRICWRPS